MTQLIPHFTDPAVSTRSGEDRLFWVGMAAGQEFPRRSGKAVDLHTRYQKATASSSNLAGWLQVDSLGVTDGHPATIAAGDKAPVNFGLDKSAVMPTSGGIVATESDIGKRFDILVDADGIQYIDMSSSAQGVLQVTDIIDDDGLWVGASIPTDKRYGTL